MKYILGMLIVLGSIVVGYGAHGGNFGVLWQPSEYLIIGGSGIGAMVIANPGHVLKATMKNLKWLFKKRPYEKTDYLELLLFLYSILRVMKMQGMLEIEKHIEDPEQSEIFSKFHTVKENHHAVHFISDNIRILTMGLDDVYQMDDAMTAELELHHHETHATSAALINLGDSFPALGIVAAVLGVITTMGSITEPPEILGGLIGAALVGTFTGVLLAYGIAGPMGNYVGTYGEDEGRYYEVIKTAILSHMKGNAPQISVEFARKVIPSVVRPSFSEVETAIGEL